jgi:hypothetical protein
MVIEHSSDDQEEMIHRLDQVVALVEYQDDDAREKKKNNEINFFDNYSF